MFFLFVFVLIVFDRKLDKPMPYHRRQLTTWKVFCQVEGGDFTAGNRTANIFLEVFGIFPPSSSSLELSWTTKGKIVVEDALTFVPSHDTKHCVFKVSHGVLFHHGNLSNYNSL